MRTRLIVAGLVLGFVAGWVPGLLAQEPWVVFEGKRGPGRGKHIVLIAGDQEYRSEEAIPMLARILAERHGFKCTVLFSINRRTGEIDPPTIDNIPGLEALKNADLAVLFLRWLELPDDQMKHIIDYTNSGKPIVALRTSTHPFNYQKNLGSPYAKYSWRNKEFEGGYGRQVLGETWVRHWGKHNVESTRGVIAPGMENHPILKGVKDIWGESDVYEITTLTGDSKPLVMGQVLTGMQPDSPPLPDKKMMPVAWTKTYIGDSGKTARIFTTTMGHANDFKNEGFRRMVVNACYWAMGMENRIRGDSNVDIVGAYDPLPIGMKPENHRKGIKPADLKRAARKSESQAAALHSYYVDCANGSDAAAGTGPGAAWRTLAKVSATTFAPGDAILLRRGTRCQGMLWPKGSGEDGRPIRLGAYGTGPLPIIAADTSEAAVKLFDQQHWVIENLETTGGNPYGVFVSGTSGSLRHFRLRNLVVHDVTGTVKTKQSGLVLVRAPRGLQIEDVEIDGVTAYNTTQWSGIQVTGGWAGDRVRNVTIRNSIVHDVYGDGIVLFQVENGLIEKSAAWLTGLQPTQTIGTPNGIWTWRCRNCTVQLTEGFLTDSPGVDGGIYDIDWGNDDNTVQSNYGHDAMGYCASVFAAGKGLTANSVIRYNVCVDNGRSPKLAKRQGDIYISTWDGGRLDGVQIHNNTIRWNPPIDVPAVQMDHAEFTGSRANVFRNNVILSGVPSMIHSSGDLKFERNVYWYESGQARWAYGEREHIGFAEYQRAVGQETGEMFIDPRLDALLRPQRGSPLIDAALALPAMPDRDGFGAAIPQGKGFDIGAIEWTPDSESAASARPSTPALPALRAMDAGRPVRSGGKWLLLLFAGPDSADARSQLVFLQTAVAQYGRTTLDTAVAWDGRDTELANLRYDWNLGEVRLLAAESVKALRSVLALSPARSRRTDAGRSPAMVLISPTGKVVARWERFATPADLGLALRRHLGRPS